MESRAEPVARLSAVVAPTKTQVAAEALTLKVKLKQLALSEKLRSEQALAAQARRSAEEAV